MTAVAFWGPPLLSDQWVTTYLQILFQLTVFAIGVPAMVYQLQVPEDLRRVVQRRHPWLIWGWISMTVFFFVSFSAFIWFMPDWPREAGDNLGRLPQMTAPTQAKLATPVVQTSPTAQTDPITQAVNPVPSTATPAQSPSVGTSGATASSPAHVPANIRTFSLVAALLVTVVPFATFIFSLVIVAQLTRPKVLKRLARALRPHDPNKTSLDYMALEHLLYLGAHSKAGRLKALVIMTIDEVAIQVQNCPGYNGSELEELLRGLQTVLCHAEQPGDDENFMAAAGLLSRAWGRLAAPDLKFPSDAQVTLEMIKHLSLYAVTHRSEQTAFIFLEASAECDSDIVFEVGLTALQNKKFFLADSALTKLEGMLAMLAAPNNARGTQEEVKSNLLGLIAHFIVSGRTATLRAQLALRGTNQYFIPTLNDAINDAFQYQYQMCRYETADHLLSLSENLAGPQPRFSLN